MAELFANSPSSTLSAAMTDTTGTSLSVTSAASFSAAVTGTSQFRILVDSEIMIVTNVSGTTFTVTRGAEGSTAATHLSGATVTQIVTAGALNAVVTPSGGTTGQVLAKTSSADYASSWIDTPVAALAPAGSWETTSRLWTPSLGNQTLTANGREQFMPIWLPKGYTLGKITFVTATTGATSPTHWWFALYDSARVLLAITADQTTTAWGSFTAKTLPIATTAAGAATSFTTTYAGIHYVSVLVAATTPPNFVGIPNFGSPLTTIAPVLYGGVNTDGALTSPWTFPRTAVAPGTGGPLFYCYVSP